MRSARGGDDAERCLHLGDRQMKTYQYKPDAQASAFHRHAENASTRLRVGLVLAVQQVGSLLPLAKIQNPKSKIANPKLQIERLAKFSGGSFNAAHAGEARRVS